MHGVLAGSIVVGTAPAGAALPGALVLGGLASVAILAVLLVRGRAARRTHAATLARERALARDILEALTVDGLLAFGSDGRVVHANAVAARAFGRSREDLIGERIGELAPPIVRAELSGLARRARSEGVPLTTVQLAPPPWSRWVEITFLPGADSGLVMHLRDVDARERAEAERRAASDRAAERARDLRRLADAMPQIVWTAGPDGASEFLNARWEDFSGFEAGQGGSPVATPLLHPDDAGRCQAAWAEAVSTGGAYEIEHRFWDRRTQAWRWFLSRALPATDETGRVVHWYGTSTDIDGLEQAKEAREASLAATREALRVREEFVSVASHELRTPLTTLSLHADLLAHRLSTEGAPPSLAWVPASAATIVAQAERMAHLVDTLLDVSRIAVGRLRLRPEPLDLADLAREVVDRVADAQEEVPIRFEASGAADGRWDRLRVEQVVANLLSNALKYGQRRPVDVRVDGDGDRIRVSVRDRGIGIAPGDLARIFERFERAVSDRHFGGLGLGLWISREIADAMGGSLHVESEPGQGSTFTLELPR